MPQYGVTRGDAGRASLASRSCMMNTCKNREKGGKKAERERGKSCCSSPAHPSCRAVGPATGAGPAPAWRAILSCSSSSSPHPPHLRLPLPLAPAPGARVPALCPASSIPESRARPPHRPASSLQLPAVRGWASLLSMSVQLPKSLGRISSSQSTAFN